ncbi:MAG TPA: helix-turn-helix transcriptional regulator [Candidatus Fimicola cottocaccae]|uniref:helix-turn-helix domain-containing protein n=1 Tax=Tyzzerella sp. An114 TaxID=1965545 RepID=UPI0013026E09|nr:helix-turn-helix transcriptional regulator [Tyzzerella sp. An114]HIT72111.1 helix-turn-helix transcriptional regulator [Candidatus Fimicola cottocaccae]
MEFKDRLRFLRKEKHHTQKKLGEILNYGYTAISNYESGRNEPSISDIKKIAKFFDVSVDYLLCVNDIRNPYLQEESSESFMEFKNLFSKLDEDNKEELLRYMKYLSVRDSIDENAASSTSILKVAEEKETYTTKKTETKTEY